MMGMSDARHQIGGNNPPEELSFEEIVNGADDIYDEAKEWLDGEEITTQKQADNLALLGDQIKKLAKAAEEMRKARKKPHDDAAKAVQAQFKPIQEKLDRAKNTLQSALKPFMLAKEREQREAAEKARQEAEQKRREAEEAIRASSSDNLAEREEAERKIEYAKEAEQAAKEMTEAKPHVKGEGRAMTVVTTYKGVITDWITATAAVYAKHPNDFYEVTQSVVDRMVRNGERDIPGVEIEEVKNVRG
jgi:paraquat-inducible protein B